MNSAPLTIHDPAPLLGDTMRTQPFTLRLGTGCGLTRDLLSDQAALQRHIERSFALGFNWGVGPYLEDREPLLARFPQMAGEQRFWHLGLDVIVPYGTLLFAPLEGVVRESGEEKGEGNYGGYVLLEHADACGQRFFCLFGHLQTFHLPSHNSTIGKGSAFAIVGDRSCNGGWFSHTHMQLLTPKALEEGWLHRGYCTLQQLPTIATLCPDPAVMMPMLASS